MDGLRRLSEMRVVAQTYAEFGLGVPKMCSWMAETSACGRKSTMAGCPMTIVEPGALHPGNSMGHLTSTVENVFAPWLSLRVEREDKQREQEEQTSKKGGKTGERQKQEKDTPTCTIVNYHVTCLLSAGDQKQPKWPCWLWLTTATRVPRVSSCFQVLADIRGCGYKSTLGHSRCVHMSLYSKRNL